MKKQVIMESNYNMIYPTCNVAALKELNDKVDLSTMRENGDYEWSYRSIINLSTC